MGDWYANGNFALWQGIKLKIRALVFGFISFNQSLKTSLILNNRKIQTKVKFCFLSVLCILVFFTFATTASAQSAPPSATSNYFDLIEEREFITFILTVWATLFLFINRSKLQSLPNLPLLLLAFLFLSTGTFLTITEAFIFPEISNWFENTCFTLHTIILTYWSIRFIYKEKEKARE